MYALVLIVPGYENEIDELEGCAAYSNRETAERHERMLSLMHGSFYHVIELPPVDETPAELNELGSSDEDIFKVILDRNDKIREESERKMSEQRKKNEAMEDLRAVIKYAKFVVQNTKDRDVMSRRLNVYVRARRGDDELAMTSLISAGELILEEANNKKL